MSGLRARKKEATRKAILRAAYELSVAHGFAATTMEQVAAAAGVSVGSLYNYFANKSALLLGIFGDSTRDILAEGQAVLDDPGDDARTAIFRLLHIYLESIEHLDKNLLREAIAIGFSGPPEVMGELAGLDMMLAEQLGALVEQLRGRGLITDEVSAEQATLALFGTLATALITWMSLPEAGHTLLHTSLDAQLEVVFRGLNPRPAPPE